MDQYSWIGAFGAWVDARNWQNLTTGQNPASTPPGAADAATIAGFSLLVILGPGAASSLTSGNDTAYDGNFAIGGALSTSANFTLMAASTLSAASVATNGNTAFLVSGTGARLADSGAFALDQAVLQVSNHGALQVAGLTLAPNSYVLLDDTGSLEVGGTGGAAAGALTVDAGAAVYGAGIIGPKVLDGGTITAAGGTLMLEDDVAGGGSLAIGAGATLQLLGSSIAPAIAFNGAAGTLELAADTPPAVTGTISGFAAGDLLLLDGVEADQASLAAGTLTISNAGVTILTLNVAGTYPGQTFYAVPFIVTNGLSGSYGSTGTAIEVLPTIPVSAAPPGTPTGQSFDWVGTSGAWADVRNWQQGGLPATTAPGTKDSVRLLPSLGTSPDIVVGAGNAAGLSMEGGDFALDGTFNLGSLAVNGVLAIMAGSSVAAGSVSIGDEGLAGSSLVVSGTGASLTDASDLTFGGNTGGSGTVAVSNHGTLRTTGIAVSVGLHFQSSATISVDGTGTLEVGTAGGATAGTLTVDPDGSVGIQGTITATVVDNGVIAPVGGFEVGPIGLIPIGGVLTINGDVSGSGRLEIGDADTLTLAGSSIATAIAFTGAGGLLDLPALPAALSGTISGFAPGDLIRFDTTPIDSAAWIATGGGFGTLTLSNAGATVGTLTLAGDYTGDTFYVVPNSNFIQTGAEIEVLPTIARSAAPPGGTPAAYVWNGGSGAWADAIQWQVGGTPTSIAPGIRDDVTINGSSPSIIVGDGDAASLTVTGSVALDGQFNVAGALADSGTLALMAGSSLAAASVQASSQLLVSGTGARLTDSGALTVQGSAQIADHAVAQAASLSMQGGILSVDDTASLEVGGMGGAAAGVLTIDAGATVQGFGIISGAVVDNGTVAPSGPSGFFEVVGDLTGNGSIQVAGQSTLFLGGTTITPEIDFVGSNGTLEFTSFAPPPSPVLTVSGVISGFSDGDAIKLDGIASDQAVWAATGGGLGTLTISNAGAAILTLTLAGDYTGRTFYAVPRGSSGFAGTEIVIGATLCFVAGTLILTERGEVPVEALAPGDRVVTEQGGTRPVRWVGRRTIDLVRHPAPTRVRPIRIRRDAFAPGAPLRDLWLSPDHAVFAEGVLIPVKHLVNDATIAPDAASRTVRYCHVELDAHDVLLAEGLPAESLVPGADRSAFDNGDGPVQLHPDFHSLAWEADGYAPLVVTGPEFDRVRARLAERAQHVARERRSMAR